MVNHVPEPDRIRRSAMSDPRDPGRTGETAGTPRWVKVFGVVAVLVAALVVVMLLSGHGPSRHG